MDAVVYNAVRNKRFRSAVYKTSGTWTAPATCTEVYITGCGAGAGGYSAAGTAIAGNSGGTTSFGVLFSLVGGSGTGAGAGAGGDGSQPGLNYVNPSTYNVGGYGGGGFSPITPSSISSGTKGALGSGGSAGSGLSPAGTGPGGGAGDYVYKQPVTVTPNTAYTITIGSGGTTSGNGGKGGDGYMLIEWWE